MKKILVSDYDQTFYLNDKDIEINKNEVKKFKKDGNIFIIATGRSFFDFKNKVHAYNIDYDYVILNHGATTLDKNDNIISNFPIYNEVVGDIKNNICLEESLNNFCCSELESRVDFDYDNLTKIHVKYETKEKAMQINDIINNKYSRYVISYYVTCNSIEIISNKTNKSNAIRLLTEKLNIDTSNVYSIGDGYSDIQMVKDFNGYCMKDSVNELKQVAVSEVESVSELVKELLRNAKR
ncbi:MAG: HAD hydrolase family protein [Clostridia bacterium]|nr:HAD hydrolase family protein [Clostridia bacterium]